MKKFAYAAIAAAALLTQTGCLGGSWFKTLHAVVLHASDATQLWGALDQLGIV